MVKPGGRFELYSAATRALRAFLSCIIWVVGTVSIGHAESLDDALVSAYVSNPTLLAAQAGLRHTDELVPQALAGWRPQAGASIGGGYADSNSAATSIGGTNSTHNLSTSQGPTAVATLTVRQQIYKFGLSDTVSQAKNTVRANRAQVASEEQDTLLRAATAYVDTLKAQYDLRFSVDHQQLLKSELETTQRRLNLGEVRNSDVAQSEASYAAATAQRTQAEGLLAVSRETYRAVVGHEPGNLAIPDLPKGLPATEEQVLAAAESNPAVSAADYAERAARDGVEAAYGEKLPDFYLQASAEPTGGHVLALMSVPIYTGVLDSKVRSAKELVEQRRLDADAQRLQARQSAMSAWQQLQTARANVNSFEAQVHAAELAAASVAREQNAGLRTVYDVLVARQQVLDSQLSLTGARRDAVVAAYQTLAAIGRLSARDLGLDVPYYDDKSHYRSVKDKWWGTGPDMK
ncbi:MAG: TolC family outer membrane protein [Rhodospirillales bacterium]|nr:TolC family outer membrane protein [Rhodospirillales bacterium]